MAAELTHRRVGDPQTVGRAAWSSRSAIVEVRVEGGGRQLGSDRAHTDAG